MTFGPCSSLNLLKCNIWAESDCTTNLFTDYHKLINYGVMMCPNGLIIAFSQAAHIVPSSYRRPRIFSKKKKSGSVDAYRCICRSDTCGSNMAAGKIDDLEHLSCVSGCLYRKCRCSVRSCRNIKRRGRKRINTTIC